MEPRIVRALDLLRADALATLGLELGEPELDRFGKYLGLLAKWQRIERLVGSSDPTWIVQNMMVDSLLFLALLPPGIRSVCDVGSGAGFPGVPLKIARPHLAMTLFEPRRRRASFLAEVVRALELSGASVEPVKAEEAPESMIGLFDAALVRCAGAIGNMITPVKRLLAPGGRAIFTGPPERAPLPEGGEWVEVRGRERVRLFAVFHV